MLPERQSGPGGKRRGLLAVPRQLAHPEKAILRKPPLPPAPCYPMRQVGAGAAGDGGRPGGRPALAAPAARPARLPAGAAGGGGRRVQAAAGCAPGGSRGGGGW